MFARNNNLGINQVANANQLTHQKAAKAGRKIEAAAFMGLEALEGREMLSAAHGHIRPVRHARKVRHNHAALTAAPANSALSLSQIAVSSGTELMINGTTGNDKISIFERGTTYTIDNGTWSTTVTGTFSNLCVKGGAGNDTITLDASVTTNAIIYGSTGNDTITSGSGNDSIYASQGINYIKCGSGNDVVVTIGSAGARITAGAGSDSFWMDNSKNENVVNATNAQIAAGEIHRVSAFANFNSSTSSTPVSSSLLGQTLLEPAVTDSGITYTNFSKDPLFSSTGPGPDDIAQGDVGDCYFLATLSSIAKTDPNRIRQSIVALGDGTYAVQFFNAGTPVYERVDANLPTWGAGGSLAYADTGKQNSLWVAIMEKAFAEFRGATADYNLINSGWMSEVYSDMGSPNVTTIWSASSANNLLKQIKNLLASGDSVTMAINNPEDGAPLIGDHAYSVDHVSTDAQGNMTVVLRNPWGVDGAGNDGDNDGYVTVTAQQAFDSFSAVMGAAV